VDDARAEAPPDPVRGVVADERAGGGRGDDHRQAEITGARDDASRDHGRLTRDDRDDRVEQREQEYDPVRPSGGVGDELGEVVEHASLARTMEPDRILAAFDSSGGGLRKAAEVAGGTASSIRPRRRLTV